MTANGDWNGKPLGSLSNKTLIQYDIKQPKKKDQWGENVEASQATNEFLNHGFFKHGLPLPIQIIYEHTHTHIRTLIVTSLPF